MLAVWAAQAHTGHLALGHRAEPLSVLAVLLPRAEVARQAVRLVLVARVGRLVLVARPAQRAERPARQVGRLVLAERLVLAARQVTAVQELEVAREVQSHTGHLVPGRPAGLLLALTVAQAPAEVARQARTALAAHPAMEVPVPRAVRVHTELPAAERRAVRALARAAVWASVEMASRAQPAILAVPPQEAWL